LKDIIIFIWTAFFGLAVGSFINVCIYRIPKRESIISPPSTCPVCKERINWKDNIPIISYILLKGKCRKCGSKISIRYPTVEFLSATILCINLSVFGFNKDLFLFSSLFLILLAIAFIDFSINIIPNKLIILGLIIALIFPITDGIDMLLKSLIGGIVGGLTLFIIRFIGNKFLGKESMGWGDIKLGSMIGLFLESKLTLISIYLGFIIALFYGIFLIIKKKSFSIKPLPFGTFFTIGVYISVFFGEKIYNLYINYFTNLKI
jgi:leader peptidase (prepilin peptidase)/N-methyltransferase